MHLAGNPKTPIDILKGYGLSNTNVIKRNPDPHDAFLFCQELIGQVAATEFAISNDGSMNELAAFNPRISKAALEYIVENSSSEKAKTAAQDQLKKRYNKSGAGSHRKSKFNNFLLKLRRLFFGHKFDC